MSDDDDVLSRVAVVIVTYNSAKQIDACLSELPIEALGWVAVVDNASTDDTCERLKSRPPGICLFRRSSNVGFGRGCNEGFLGAPAGITRVLFLNPDATIAEHDLRQLCGYLDAHPSVAMVGPRLRVDGRPATSAGGWSSATSELRFVLPRRLKPMIGDRRFDAAYERTGQVAYVEGACMMVDAEAFRSIGMFDSRYFLYFEELDIAQRIRQSGRYVHLVTEAAAHHSGGASTAFLPLGGRTHYWTSTVLYLRRWHAPLGPALFTVGALVSWAYEWAAGAISRDALIESSTALRRGWQRR